MGDVGLVRDHLLGAERDAGRRLDGLTSEERIVWMLPDSFAFFSGFWIVYPVADTRASTRSIFRYPMSGSDLGIRPASIEERG